MTERDLNTLKAAIEQVGPSLTRLESRIAAYLLARPEAILLESSAETARKLDISPMTLSRFYRKLGFEGVSQARAQARKKTYGPETRRIDLRFNSGNAVARDEDEDLSAACAAMEAAFAIRRSEAWRAIVTLVSEADAVFAIGFQTMHFLADGLCRRLGYLRDRVHIVDGIDGVYADLLPRAGETTTLIMIDTYRYGAHGPLLAQLAKERGLEVVIFADEFCDWATGITPHVLRYPAETQFVLSMPQGITMGLNLLLRDVSDRLGGQARARIERLSEAQERFGLFLD